MPEQELSAQARLDRRLLQQRTEAALHELSELRPLERSPVFYVDIAQAGIDSLIADYKEHADPFVWTKSAVHQKTLKPCFAVQ